MDNRLRDLRREAEALLERISAAEVATPGLMRPVADVQELAGHYILEIELPGVRPGEVQVYSQRDSVVVEGIKPSPELPKLKALPGLLPKGATPSSMTPVSYQCLERQYGPFRRIFSLPGPCDLSQTRAELSGGILTVTIPTLAEDRRNRRRSIQISARPAPNPTSNPINNPTSNPINNPRPQRRDLVLFPYMIVPLLVAREASAAAVDLALGATKDRLVFVTAQRSEGDDFPEPDALNEIGTVGTILRMRKLSDGRMKILIQGLFRARVAEWQGRVPCHTVRVEQVHDRALSGPGMATLGAAGAPDKVAGDPYGPLATAEIEALSRQIKDDLDHYNRAGKVSSPELLAILSGVDEPGRLSDLVCANLQLKADEAQRLLEELDPLRRLRLIASFLRKEVEIIQMQEIIQARAKEVLSRNQREHFLREQLRQIHSELGGGQEGDEGAELRRRIAEAGLYGEALTEAERQVRRLETMQSTSAEYQVVRTYLDCLVELPWQRRTSDQLDLLVARRILDEDHYDLQKIKDRILEFLSVVRLRGADKGARSDGRSDDQTDGHRDGAGPLGTILCFVGPPGVGKTSLGRSIARALSRRFVRVVLGGVRDDAEVRGHRRTYVGAMPGRIIQGLRQAGHKNPVLLLDEIDKMGSEGQGDPAAALLEVLDPEQNSSFRDNYLGVPFDLSQILFIATANASDRIPQALRDRLELIHLSGYSESEKLAIAQRHVVPRAVAQAGLLPSCEVRFTAPALRTLISDYTREAGLRELERQVAAVCRKVARQVVEREDQKKQSHPAPELTHGQVTLQPVIPQRHRVVVINPKTVGKFLGAPLYQRHALSSAPARGSGDKNPVGTALGLAWTPVGGEVLEVESQWMPGKGALTLTGQLGDVMKESAQAALSYARARAAQLGLPESFFGAREIHIHVPAGAVPKDGPSAGVTVACALVSLLTGIPVRSTVAMTGEITLRGRVLPIGGLKEKLLAALRAGVKTVLVPAANRRDLDEIPRALLRGLDVVLVENMDDVLREALAGPLLVVSSGEGGGKAGKKDKEAGAAAAPGKGTKRGAAGQTGGAKSATASARGETGGTERASRNGPGRFLKA
jgi:ATP-dependent Lon protease